MSAITQRKYTARDRIHCGLACSALATSLVMAPALATDTPTADAAQLPAVNVEATTNAYKKDYTESSKFTQPLVDTPQTIDIISHTVTKQQQATTLTQALQNSPGVSAFSMGENGSSNTGDAVFMRGFNASGSLFIDGIRDLGAITRDLFDTENVEVVKGPDGTIVGRTTPSGAINMVSKQPHRGNKTAASVSYGTSNQKRATLDVNRDIGSNAAFRLNLMRQKSGVPGRDDVNNDSWGVAPSLALGLGTPTRIYFDLLHVTQDNVPDGGVPTIGMPGYSSSNPALDQAPQVDSHNFYGTPQDKQHVTSDMATIRLEHDFSNSMTLRDTLRWARTSNNYLETGFKSDAADIDTSNPDMDAWTINREPIFNQQTNRILVNQTNISTDFMTGAIEHNLDAGVELSQEKVAIGGRGALGGAWTPANLYHPYLGDATGLLIGDTGTGSNGRTNTAGIYAFDTLKFGKRWLLTAGARLDGYNTRFTSTVQCGTKHAPACGVLAPNTLVRGLNVHDSGHLTSYKLGLVYKPTMNSSVYTDFATAEEPPGGNNLVFSPKAGNADGPGFKPQKARTIEVGTKWDVLDKQLRLTAALYQTTVTNLIVPDAIDPNEFQQVGRERVRGIELGAVGRITPNWAVTAGYTIMHTHADSNIVSSSTTSSSTSNGSSALAYAPKSAFTTWSTWKLPRHVTLGAGARYMGEVRRGTSGNTDAPTTISPYWVFDAMVGYALNQHTNLQLNVYNLANKHYVAAINKMGYRYAPGLERSAVLTLNITY